MNYFQEALASRQSTILWGPFGRQPHLVQFYLEAIPELEYASDYELVFWHCKKRLLHVLLEPPFDAVIPGHLWTLVLTSHVRLCFDPRSTRIVQCHPTTLLDVPDPRTASADASVVLPPTSHTHPFLKKQSRVDLSSVDSSHEAYLRLLTLYDVLRPDSEWSLTLSMRLRQALSKDVPGTGPYDAHLLRFLG